MSPTLYKRRPSTVEAMPFKVETNHMIDVAAWVSKSGGAVVRRVDGSLTIRHKGQETHVLDGQYLVRDHAGRFYAYDEATFKAYYVDIF